MRHLLRNRISKSFAICFVAVLTLSLQANAGFISRGDIQPEHLQKILNMGGIEAEVLELNREDGFDEGVFFELPDGTALIIGFPRNGIQNGKPFLLSTLYAESIVQLSDDGTISIINDDNGVISQNIIDVIACQLSVTLGMVNAISSCVRNILDINPLCFVDAVLDGVIGIPQCVLLGLSE